MLLFVVTVLIFASVSNIDNYTHSQYMIVQQIEYVWTDLLHLTHLHQSFPLIYTSNKISHQHTRKRMEKNKNNETITIFINPTAWVYINAIYDLWNETKICLIIFHLSFLKFYELNLHLWIRLKAMAFMTIHSIPVIYTNIYTHITV